MNGAAALLLVDGAAVGAPRVLAGDVLDCGVASAECITHVGQRQGGVILNGCVAAASLLPNRQSGLPVCSSTLGNAGPGPGPAPSPPGPGTATPGGASVATLNLLASGVGPSTPVCFGAATGASQGGGLVVGGLPPVGPRFTAELLFEAVPGGTGCVSPGLCGIDI